MRPQRLFLLTLLLILSPGLTGAFAQQASRRIEVAGGASVLRLTRSDATATGMAGRFSFDVTNWLSAEAEMAFFPSDDIIIRDRGLSVDFAIGHNRRRDDPSPQHGAAVLERGLYEPQLRDARRRWTEVLEDAGSGDRPGAPTPLTWSSFSVY